MAIMKWNTPPSGDQGDRKAHVVGHGDGVALVHAVSGDKVEGGGAQGSTNPNVELATKWSTAPYRGPKIDDDAQPNRDPHGYRSIKRAKKCMGNDDTCMAWATVKYEGMYCNAHGQSAAKAD